MKERSLAPLAGRGAGERGLTGHAQEASDLLARAQQLETIPAVYMAWDELRAARRLTLQHFEDERRRLDEQGDLLLGAVEDVAADTPPPPPSAPRPDALVQAADAPAVEHFLTEARARLEDARAQLDEEERQARLAFGEADAELRAIARARVEARAQHARPHVRLIPRSVGTDRRILHLERPEPDDAVVLFFLFSGHLPSRYAAPFDDSTDDVITGPTTLYPDEGVKAGEVRPSPTALRAALQARPEVWPVKGSLPLPIKGGRLVRWVSRGPVLEAELDDGAAYRNLLSAEEAEQITGALLRLKLAHKLELELGRG